MSDWRVWLKDPDPAFCNRRVSDGNYRAPHFYQCRKKVEKGQLICRFHRLGEERAEKKAKAYAATQNTSARNEREGQVLARRLKLKDAHVYYQTMGRFVDHGYTRELVVGFEELKRLAGLK